MKSFKILAKIGFIGCFEKPFTLNVDPLTCDIDLSELQFVAPYVKVHTLAMPKTTGVTLIILIKYINRHEDQFKL